MTELVEPLASPPLDTKWVPLWPLAPSKLGELAYAERTSDFNISTTEGVIVTAPAVTTDGNTPLVIEFGAAGWGCSAAAQAYAVLYEDGVNLGILTTTSETGWKPCAGMRRRTPAAGSHVYQMRASMGSGTGIIVAGAGGPAVNTPAFIRVSLAAPLLSAPPGAAVPVQYGTSLPTNPLDGQEAILVDSLTNPSYQWRFRYNAGSSSAYKWEFVGGPYAESRIDTSQAQATPLSTVYDLATPGPDFIIPRTGDYMIECRATLANGGGFIAGVAIPETATGLFPSIGGVSQSWGTTYTSGWIKVGATAGQRARMRYYQSVANTAFSERRIYLYPARVS